MDLVMLAETPAMYQKLINPLTCAMCVVAVVVGVIMGWRRK